VKSLLLLYSKGIGILSQNIAIHLSDHPLIPNFTIGGQQDTGNNSFIPP
jgi:hypothetical protein